MAWLWALLAGWLTWLSAPSAALDIERPRSDGAVAYAYAALAPVDRPKRDEEEN